jgi:hypothetical protein
LDQLVELAARYHGVTQAILEWSGVNDKLLHVHAGLAIMLAARIVSGRSLASWVPFAAVVVAEAGNELADAIFFGAWRWEDTWLDVANTLFWPALLMVGLRLRRVRA